MGAAGLRGGRFEGIHTCMCLLHQHTSRCTGKCVEGCRDSTGLVEAVSSGTNAQIFYYLIFN